MIGYHCGCSFLFFNDQGSRIFDAITKKHGGPVITIMMPPHESAAALFIYSEEHTRETLI